MPDEQNENYRQSVDIPEEFMNDEMAELQDARPDGGWSWEVTKRFESGQAGMVKATGEVEEEPVVIRGRFYRHKKLMMFHAERPDGERLTDGQYTPAAVVAKLAE